jgi:hypothetical protein
MIQRLVQKCRNTGLVLDRKNRKESVLREKNDETGGSLKKTRRSLTCSGAQPGVSLGPAHTAMRLLKFQPHANPESDARIRCCNWLLGPMHDGTVHPEVLIF